MSALLDGLRRYSFVPPTSLVELEAGQLLSHRYKKAAGKVRIHVTADEFQMNKVHVRVWLRHPRMELMDACMPLRSVEDAQCILEAIGRELAAVEAEEDMKDAGP